MKTAFFAALLTVISFPSTVLAADDPGDTVSASSTAPTQGVDVRSIISSVSQQTHRKFLIDPRVRATVQLDGVGPRDVTYPLLLTILEVHGFAVYEQEGVVVVTPDANERFFPSSVVNADAIRAPDAEVVTTIVTLKSAKAVELVSILRPLVALNGQINAVGDRNAIVIVDRAAEVRRLVTLIRELDKVPAYKPE